MGFGWNKGLFGLMVFFLEGKSLVFKKGIVYGDLFFLSFFDVVLLVVFLGLRYRYYIIKMMEYIFVVVEICWVVFLLFYLRFIFKEVY